MIAVPLKAPFPAFGGKSQVASLVWERLGEPRNYIDFRKWYIAPSVTPNLAAHSFCVPSPRVYASQAFLRAVVEWVGGRPVLLVVLLVLQRILFRAATKFFIAFAANSERCSARCSALLTSSRFSTLSLSLFRSRWWIPIPAGIGPCSRSHTNCDLKTQVLGSDIFMKARRSPPLE